MNLQTCYNLQLLIEENPNIELIEIWDSILYLRMKTGRNKFHTKKYKTKEKSGIYINWGNDIKQTFRTLQKKYHPDINPKYSYISQFINQWYEYLKKPIKFDDLKYAPSWWKDLEIWDIPLGTHAKGDDQLKYMHEMNWFNYPIPVSAEEVKQKLIKLHEKSGDTGHFLDWAYYQGYTFEYREFLNEYFPERKGKGPNKEYLITYKMKPSKLWSK